MNRQARIEKARLDLALDFAAAIQHRLTALGHCYDNKTDGRRWKVTFELDALTCVEDERGRTLCFDIPVDVHRLPERVTTEKLASEGVAHELATYLRRPVEAQNSSGLAYRVWLVDPASETVDLPRRVDLDLDEQPRGEYVVGIGVSRDGAIWRPIEGLGHLLVAGSTGSGKSAFLRLLLYQVLRQPLPVELYLADLEDLTFRIFESVPALQVPVAGNVEEAEAITAKLVAEMQRRSRLYAATGRFPESPSEYHAVSDERLPRVVAVFDEFSAFVEAAGKRSQFYEDVAQLAMRSRKYGMTLVFAGQDFKADLLNTRITNQLLCRVQFQCANDTQSRVVLGVDGAEKLKHPGRALVSLSGQISEVQAFWIDKAEIIEQLGVTAPEPADLLTDQERRIANIAKFDLDGSFGIDDIYSRTGPASEGGVSRRWLVETAKTWERKGWLKRDPGNPTAPRRITEDLSELVARSDGR